MRQRVILLEPLAPPKPPEGRACNGCGVCCAVEPCPLGAWLPRRGRNGAAGGRACAALTWIDDERRYRCGVLVDPRRWLPVGPAALGRALVRRWIAAGHGCDCDFEPAAAAQGIDTR